MTTKPETDIARRYKSKMCANYLRDGVCPYEMRCMFAHGESELRSEQENIRDGLTTEAAIKARQNDLLRRVRQQERRVKKLLKQATLETPAPTHCRTTSGAKSTFYTHDPYSAVVLPPEEQEAFFAIKCELALASAPVMCEPRVSGWPLFERQPAAPFAVVGGAPMVEAP